MQSLLAAATTDKTETNQPGAEQGQRDGLGHLGVAKEVAVAAPAVDVDERLVADGDDLSHARCVGERVLVGVRFSDTASTGRRSTNLRK